MVKINKANQPANYFTLNPQQNSEKVKKEAQKAISLALSVISMKPFSTEDLQVKLEILKREDQLQRTEQYLLQAQKRLQKEEERGKQISKEWKELLQAREKMQNRHLYPHFKTPLAPWENIDTKIGYNNADYRDSRNAQERLRQHITDLTNDKLFLENRLQKLSNKRSS